MFDDSPLPGRAGELEQVNTHRFCVRGKCTTVVDGDDADAGVLQLDDVDDQAAAGDAAAAASSDGGVDALERDAATVDAGNTVVSDAGALERDATVSNTNDSSTPLEPDAGAGDASTGPMICTAMCIDGTFKCPSASSSSGYVCRSWPPCYCNPDSGM
jgi:hypothetical protein